MPIDNDALTGAPARRKPKADVTEIGGHPLSPSTLMMGNCYDPMLSEGSPTPPVFLTSTFVLETHAAGQRHFGGLTGTRPVVAERLDYPPFKGPKHELPEAPGSA